MNTAEVILSIAAGLAVNEFCDICPWAARKISTWSAHARYGKSERAEIRAEELAAVIDSRPGKLFKLLTALAFACGATSTRAYRVLVWLQLYYNAIGGRPNRRRPSRRYGEIIYIGRGSPTDSEAEKRFSMYLGSELVSHGIQPDEQAVLQIRPTDHMLQALGRVNRRASE